MCLFSPSPSSGPIWIQLYTLGSQVVTDVYILRYHGQTVSPITLTLHEQSMQWNQCLSQSKTRIQLVEEQWNWLDFTTKKAIKLSSPQSKHKQSPKSDFLNHLLYQKLVDLGMIILPFYAQTWSDLSTTVKSHYDKRNRSLLASRMEPTVQMRRVKMRMEEQIWQYMKSMSQKWAPILQWNQVLPLESIRDMFYQ